MSVGRVAVTRGVLLRLREQLEFTKRGKELLEMKRDNLAAETNRLLAKINARHEFEQRLMETYSALRTAYMTLGYSRLQSQASTVIPLEAKVRLRSVMGVLVPEIVRGKESTINSVIDPSAYAAAQQMTESLGKLLTIAEAEARIESIAQELMLTNRKVNALERVILPGLMETLRYIEGRLEEETLEEFFRAKRVKAVIRGTK
ncbi:MAG: V-type ATP synthase subunit D [Candidatus Bathyarchaeia archaeon]|jgi:V/A-type H+-transporting ATPase subunit D